MLAAGKPVSIDVAGRIAAQPRRSQKDPHSRPLIQPHANRRVAEPEKDLVSERSSSGDRNQSVKASNRSFLDRLEQTERRIPWNWAIQQAPIRNGEWDPPKVSLEGPAQEEDFRKRMAWPSLGLRNWPPDKFGFCASSRSTSKAVVRCPRQLSRFRARRQKRFPCPGGSPVLLPSPQRHYVWSETSQATVGPDLPAKARGSPGSIVGGRIFPLKLSPRGVSRTQNQYLKKISLLCYSE